MIKIHPATESMWPAIAEARRAGSSDWFITTEERAIDARDAVPPRYFRGGFFLGEASAHDDRGRPVHTAFVRVGDVYYCRDVAVDRVLEAVAELHEALRAPPAIDLDTVHAWCEEYDGRPAEGWLLAVLNGDITIAEMRAAIIERRAPLELPQCAKEPS
jgi:hypothetical protein